MENSKHESVDWEGRKAITIGSFGVKGNEVEAVGYIINGSKGGGTEEDFLRNSMLASARWR